MRTARQKGPRGHAGARRLNGRKRQLLTDTLGLPLALEITAGDVQDRTAAWSLLPGWLKCWQSLKRLWADHGYKSEPLRAALHPQAELEFVGAAPGQKGFAVQPCRWRIEGSFSWASNWRRLRSDTRTKSAATAAPSSFPPSQDCSSTESAASQPRSQTLPQSLWRKWAVEV